MHSKKERRTLVCSFVRDIAANDLEKGLPFGDEHSGIAGVSFDELA